MNVPKKLLFHISMILKQVCMTKQSFWKRQIKPSFGEVEQKLDQFIITIRNLF